MGKTKKWEGLIGCLFLSSLQRGFSLFEWGGSGAERRCRLPGISVLKEPFLYVLLSFGVSAGLETGGTPCGWRD